MPLPVRASALLLLFPLTIALSAEAQTRADPEAATGLAPKPAVQAGRHMVVAAHPEAARAGRDVLRAGGSAVDAAIATLLVLNVVEPQSSGIGGGGFALVDDPERGVSAWDGRETAPAAATGSLFLEDGEPLKFFDAVASGRSVGVPGLVGLMGVLHRRHGVLPWARLFEPAVALARDGFPVSPRLAGLIAQYQDRLEAAPAGALFVPGGEPLAEGEILRNPDLAASFEAIAAKGPGVFYRGDIAGQIVDAVTSDPRPGAFSRLDMAAYGIIQRDPVCIAYRTHWRVCGMGPPSSGATTVGQILGILDRFDLAGMTLDDPRLWHLFAEASARAYADRATYLADPDAIDVPVAGLLDPVYLAGRAAGISPERATPDRVEAGDPPWREGGLYAPDLQPDLPGTTHLSVVDANGLAVSLTASIETAFGSGRVAGGFLLNNQLTDFSFRPFGDDGAPIANAPDAGKRPRSSMAPTIVYREGEAAILTGSPGGSRIPEYVAASLVAMIDFGAGPAEAAALAHVSQRNGGKVTLEPGIAPGVADGLAELGHTVDFRDMVSGLHIIAIGPDGLTGGADPRREGEAHGD